MADRYKYTSPDPGVHPIFTLEIDRLQNGPDLFAVEIRMTNRAHFEAIIAGIINITASEYITGWEPVE